MEKAARGLAGFIMNFLYDHAPPEAYDAVRVELGDGSPVVGARMEQIADNERRVTFKLVLRGGGSHLK